MSHDIDIGMKKHLKTSENVFLVTIGTPGYFRPVPATIYIRRHIWILQKYQKIDFFNFWLFFQFFHFSMIFLTFLLVVVKTPIVFLGMDSFLEMVWFDLPLQAGNQTGRSASPWPDSGLWARHSLEKLSFQYWSNWPTHYHWPPVSCLSLAALFRVIGTGSAPRRLGPQFNYLLAKNDSYFLYPNAANRYKNKLQNSFQHGGISLEEMLIPVFKMKGITK